MQVPDPVDPSCLQLEGSKPPSSPGNIPIPPLTGNRGKGGIKGQKNDGNDGLAVISRQGKIMGVIWILFGVPTAPIFEHLTGYSPPLEDG